MSKLNILFATMWGNAEDVAKRTEELAKEKGLETNVQEMNEISIEDLKQMESVAFVTSTTGQGDFPTNGESFWDLLSKEESKLENLKYSVCALGDSSHDVFCGAGKKLDEKLSNLNAIKILDRQECDGDDTGSEEWAQQFLEKISN